MRAKENEKGFEFGRSNDEEIVLFYKYWDPQLNALRPTYRGYPYPVKMRLLESWELRNLVEVIIDRRPKYTYVGEGFIDRKLYEKLQLLATKGIYEDYNKPNSEKSASFNGFPPEIGSELAQALSKFTWFRYKAYVELEFEYKEGKLKVKNFALQHRLDNFLNES